MLDQTNATKCQFHWVENYNSLLTLTPFLSTVCHRHWVAYIVVVPVFFLVEMVMMTYFAADVDEHPQKTCTSVPDQQQWTGTAYTNRESPILLPGHYAYSQPMNQYPPIVHYSNNQHYDGPQSMDQYPSVLCYPSSQHYGGSHWVNQDPPVVYQETSTSLQRESTISLTTLVLPPLSRE